MKYMYIAVEWKAFEGENFLFRYRTRILQRKLADCSSLIIMWVCLHNLAEKTLADCSSLIIMWVCLQNFAEKTLADCSSLIIMWVCLHNLAEKTLADCSSLIIMWVCLQNFAEKTLADGSETAKTAKVFSLEIIPLAVLHVAKMKDRHRAGFRVCGILSVATVRQEFFVGCKISLFRTNIFDTKI